MWVEVESSWIKAVNYFAEEQALEVALRDGRTYVYFGVSKEIFDEMMSAESKGKFYNKLVKGSYNSLRLDQPRA